jgi:uncharacterized protein YjbI with pentapeptide repeats
MRVIKPFCASVLTRPFELRRKQYLGVSVLLFSPLDETVKVLPEKELWPFWATQPEAQGALEEGFPRQHGEYLVCGSAWTTPQRNDAVAVRAQVGSLAKELVVWGERRWEGHTASPAQPFKSMRLGWALSYGGADFAANPLGMGRAAIDDAGRQARPLARIEYPQHPAQSPRQEGVPAGLGPIDAMWPQRAALRGTYDAAWLKQDFPGLASDIDWHFFNLAPADQQQPRAFVGDEAFAFHNLHASKAELRGHLPGLSARVFVSRQGATKAQQKSAQLEGVKMRLTTLWFFPNEERLIQVFQGALEVEEDDASDIELLLAAVERTGQERPEVHYQSVRDKRLDKKLAALETLRESDLVPADIAVPLHDFTPSPNRGLERGLRRAEAQRQAARDDVIAHGLDPDEHAPAVKAPQPPPVRSIDDLIVISQQMEQAGAQAPARAAAEKAKTVADARAVFEREGLDFSVIEAEMAGQLTRGPPKAMAPGLMEDFRRHIDTAKLSGADVTELHQMLADPKVMAQWAEGDQAQLAGYRQVAQHQAPATVLSLAESADIRQRVLGAWARGESMAGWDLTGADLSQLDLHGADLRLALLEGATLNHCNLSGAQLEGALLVRAQINASYIDAACLARCNLSAARIAHSSLRAVDLRGALLESTSLKQVDLSRAQLDEVRLHEVQFDGVDFNHARSDSMLTLRGLNLSRVHFGDAEFKQVVFLECDLTGSDLSGARFGKVAFVNTRADGARFDGMHIGAGCFAMGCSLQNASLRGVTMQRVCLRATVLTGADFSGARLRGSDFSECDLRGAKFHGADAAEARFVRAHLDGASLASANLAGAVLQHAWLQDTDFRQANLHESDMARVRLGTKVIFDGARTSRMRTLPRRQTSRATT